MKTVRICPWDPFPCTKHERGTTKFVSYQCNQYTNIQSKCNAAREFLTGMMCIFSAKDFCLFLCLSLPCGRINDLCGSNRLVGSCAYTQHWADISVSFAGKPRHNFQLLNFLTFGSAYESVVYDCWLILILVLVCKIYKLSLKEDQI